MKFFSLFLIIATLSILVSSRVNAAINNTIKYQSKLTNKTTGLSVSTGSPACVVAGATNDTCDFRVRIWNHITNNSTTPTSGNLMYEELLTNIEIGESGGIFTLNVNSICNAGVLADSEWGTTGTSSTLCQLIDDSDADSTAGVDFNRADIYFEITFDPSGAWTSLASPPGGIETFTRTNSLSVPSVFVAQTLAGGSADGFVKLSPSTVQTTTSSTGAIRVNQAGDGDILQLQTAGTNRFVLSNVGLISLSQTGNGQAYAWTRNVGSTGIDEVGEVHANNEAVYVTGGFSGTNTDLDPTAGIDLRTSNGSRDIFVSKYSINGDYIWSRTLGGSGPDRGRGLVTDSSGNLYVTGTFGGTNVDLDPTGGSDLRTSNGGSATDTFISKYGSDGSYIWTRTFGSVLDDGVEAIAIDSNGDIYATGFYQDVNVDFDGTGGTDLRSTSGLSGGGYIVKYLSNGNYGWVRAFGGQTAIQSTNSWGLKVSGNFVYAVGDFGGTSLDFDDAGGTDNHNSNGSSDIFVTKYNINGNYGWTRTAGGASGDIGRGIYVYQNYLFVTGSFQGTSVDLNPNAGSDTFNSAGSTDIFLSRWDIDGNYSWSRVFGGTGAESGIGVVYEPQMGVYVGGLFASTGADFDGTGGTDSKSTAGSNDIFLSKYNLDGSYSNTYAIGGTGNDSVADVKLGTDRSVYIHGVFASTGVDFDATGGTDSRSTVGSSDVFSTKYYDGPYNGLLIGGDTNLYRNSANTLKTDDNLVVATDLYVKGFSTFTGNLKNILTVSNGSTTTTGTGSSQRNLSVSSTTNFNVGNILLINGTTYTRIDSVDSTTQMTVTPAVTWSASQSVVEYTAVKIGGDGTLVEDKFSALYTNNGIRAGGSNAGTTYNDQLISTSRGLRIYGGGAGVDFSSQTSMNLNARGLVVNKTDGTNVAGSFTNAFPPTIPRAAAVHAVYNGKYYIWGGIDNTSTPVVLNSMDVYDFKTQIWTLGTAGGTARLHARGHVYNERLFIFSGCTVTACTTRSNTVDVYNFITDSWTTASAGGTARGYGASAMYEGRVYIWGGCTGAVSCDGTILNTMDIYDMNTDSWTTGATGGTARFWHTMSQYNGRIYAFGGQITGAVVQNTMDIYDISTNSWTTGATATTARQTHTAAMFEGKMYIISGNTSGNPIATMDIYDTTKNTWNGNINMTGVSGFNRGGAVIYDLKVYMAGGCNSACSGFSGVFSLLTVYDLGVRDTVLQVNEGGEQRLRLDTNNVLTVSGTGKGLGLRMLFSESDQYVTRGYSTGVSGGSARSGAIGVVYNNKFYNYSGVVSGSFTNTIDIFDFQTQTWTTGTAGGTARRQLSAGVYNGKIYFWGGCTHLTNCSGAAINVMDIYNIATNTWTTGTSGGTARSGHSGVIYNGKFYQFAGFTTATINTVDIYDIETDSWTTGTAGGVAKRGATGVTYNNKFYHWAGCNALTCTGAAVLNTMDIYDFTTNSWATGTAGGTARWAHSGITYNHKLWGWGGINSSSTILNTMDVYDFERNIWSVGAAGGTARASVSSALHNNRMYIFEAGTVDMYDFGSSNSQDIFYIANGQGVGPDDGKLFRFDATGRAYTSKQGGWFSVGADYAEYMYTRDTTLSSGEIVKLDPEVTEVSGGGIKRVEKARDGDMIGVISTEPGFVGNIVDVQNSISNDPNWKLLSMVGQVPVKVNTENGEIKPGDRITSSSKAGEGMKADEGDTNIGIAQEGYNDETKSGIIKVMITRNNEGINNKVEIKLGKDSEAGFRVKDGRLQFRDASSTWQNVEKNITVDTGIVWNKVNDTIYADVDANDSLILGVDEENEDGSKLQTRGGIEDVGVKGLRYVKLNGGSNKIEIGGEEIGIRLSESGLLQYKDHSTNEWLSLSGMIRQDKIIDRGNVRGVSNVRQENGWGYIKSDGESIVFDEEVKLSQSFNSAPIILVTNAGSTDSEPSSLEDCRADTNFYVAPYSLKKDSFYIYTELDVPGSSKYYCYGWVASGD